MVCTIRGNICITRVSAWVYFFEKKFLRAKIVPKVSQVLCGLRDHFATTVAHLWAKCALSVDKIRHVKSSLTTRLPLNYHLDIHGWLFGERLFF